VEADVDPALALSGGALHFERRDGGRYGRAVERHVDERRYAAGCRGARRCFEPFPVGAARFVDVDVGVDDARRNDEAAEVFQRHIAGDLVARHDRFDFFPNDEHGAVAHAVGRYDAAARQREFADHQVILSAERGGTR
jgi:hypothetical protein